MNLRAENHPKIAAILYLTLAMAIWAIIENIPRYFSQHYATFEIVWLRYSVHLLFMLLVFGPRVKLRLVRTQNLKLQFLRGMLMMGMHLSFIFAIRFIPVNTTMAGFWIAPLLLLSLSALRGERPDWLQWVLTLAMFGGVLFILRPLDGLFHPGILLAVSMALCFALYMQMTRAMQGEDLFASLFYTAFSVWIVLSFLMPFYWVTPTGWDLLLFAAIGILGFVGILGFDKAGELAPTWVSAPFGFLQPLLILMGDWFLRNYYPGRLRLGVAGLIVLTLVFLLRRLISPFRVLTGYHHA